MSKKVIPTFHGTGVQRVRQCILWTWDKLKKVHWEPQRVQEQLGKQTPAELIAAGEVFYMNPCASQTIVCLEALKANVFSPTVVVDLLKVNGNVFPHFALELPIKGKLVHINFRTLHTILESGPYVHSTIPNSESIRRFRVPGNEFGMHKRLTEIRPEIWQEMNRLGYIFEHHLKRLAADATQQNFERFQRDARARKTKRLIQRAQQRKH